MREPPTFTARLYDPDEDGLQTIEIYKDNALFSTHVVRFDHAQQWATQELECLEAELLKQEHRSLGLLTFDEMPPEWRWNG